NTGRMTEGSNRQENARRCSQQETLRRRLTLTCQYRRKNRRHSPWRHRTARILELRRALHDNASCYLSFSINYSFSVIFSRPPRGYVKTKKVLHTLPAALLIILAHGDGLEPTRP